MADFTDAEMSILSDAERVALNEEEVGDAPAATDLNTVKVLESDGTVTEIVGANDKDGDSEQRTAATSEQITEQDDAPFQPKYVAPVVEGLDAKIEELSAAETALETKFDEGELTFAQFRIEQKKIERQRMDLRAQQIKGEISSEQANQASDQKWNWECQRFFKHTARTDGIDYRTEANKPLMDSINLFVIGLANMPENSDKDGEWFLARAHEMVKVQHGLKTVHSEAMDSKNEDLRKAIEARRPQTKGISDTTIAHLPSAGDTPNNSDTGSDEFADLDKLAGIDLEQKLRLMPKEVVDRYLAAR